MTNINQTLKKRRKKVVKDLGGKAIWTIGKVMEKYSKVPTTPFVDPAQFKWTNRLNSQWHVMRKELEEIL